VPGADEFLLRQSGAGSFRRSLRLRENGQRQGGEE